MDLVFRELRTAVRALGRSPGFTVTALALLCLSTGALTAVSAAFDAVLLRPPKDVREPERVRWLASRMRGAARPQGLSYPDFTALVQRMDGLVGEVAAYDTPHMSLQTAEEPLRIRGHVVAGDYFRLLGGAASLGRLFLPEEMDPEAGRAVVILGHALWRDRFGSDERVLGRILLVNGRSCEVIGVMKPGFRGPELGAEADAWIPLGAAAVTIPGLAASLQRPDARFLRSLVRLAPGVRPEVAETALASAWRGISEARGEAPEDRTLVLLPFAGGLPPDVRSEAGWSGGLLALVAALVVIITCLNIANLLLVRSAERGHDMTLRVALGASRWQLARQVITESAVLAVVGGAGGLILAGVTLRLGAAVWPAAGALGLRADLRAAAFVLATTCGAGLMFGIAPALRAARTDPMGRRGASAGRGLRRLQRALVVGQMSVSLVLLVAAGQFLVAVHAANHVDLGFTAKGVWVFSYDLIAQNYAPESRVVFEDRTIERLSAMPGVSAAALTDAAPLSGILVLSEVRSSLPADPVATTVGLAGVSPGFFDALGVGLAAGRDFEASDRVGSPPVAIVNETAARVLFPGRSPLGASLALAGEEPAPLEVVGVVRDHKYDEPMEEPRPFVYVPRAQRAFLDRTTVLVRGEGRAMPGAEALKAAIHELDPALPLFEMRALEDLVRVRLDRQNTLARMLTLFGLVGLGIAAVGLYAITSYAVARRTRELGVRMALGANPGVIVVMVLRQALAVAAAGAAVGALLAGPVVLILSRSVFGAGAGSLGVFAVSAAVLGCVALIASLAPARRAARTDPMRALHDPA